MSLDAMSAVFNQSKSSRGARCVMLALADWADDWGYVIYRRKKDRTLDVIARKANVTKRSVITILNDMVAMGELWIVKGGRGAGDVHEYRICLPGLETEEDLENGIRFGRASLPGLKRALNVDGSPGTDPEPPQHVEGKGEETSPLGKTPENYANKGEVSAVKGEVSANKGEETSPPYKNNHLTNSPTPLPPNSENGTAAASQPDGLAAPVPEMDTPMARFFGVLQARLGSAKFHSWFSDLTLISADAQSVVLGAPGIKADMIETRFGPQVADCWRAANGPVERLVVIKRALSAEERAAQAEIQKQASETGQRRRRKRRAS